MDRVRKCRVPSCGLVLTEDLLNNSHRVKLCPEHQRALSVECEGRLMRFCQQCTRLHTMDRYDGDKRSCRERLERHKRRCGGGGVTNTEIYGTRAKRARRVYPTSTFYPPCPRCTHHSAGRYAGLSWSLTGLRNTQASSEVPGIKVGSGVQGSTPGRARRLPKTAGALHFGEFFSFCETKQRLLSCWHSF